MAIGQVLLWLVDEKEFVSLQRLLQMSLEAQRATIGVAKYFMPQQQPLLACLRAGEALRLQRGAQQRFGILCIIGVHADTGAEVDV